MDRNATSALTCSNPLPDAWNPLFVIMFTIAVSIINQAKWKQMPIMIFISISGYVVSWRAGIYFKGASTVSNTLSALTVGMQSIASAVCCVHSSVYRRTSRAIIDDYGLTTGFRCSRKSSLPVRPVPFGQTGSFEQMDASILQDAEGNALQGQ